HMGRLRPSRGHLNLGNLMDVQERHITNCKCRGSGVQGQFGRSSLLREMTVGVCSLTSEVPASLKKGMPPPACFDWRGWFRAGLPFFRGDTTLRFIPIEGKTDCLSVAKTKLWVPLSSLGAHKYQARVRLVAFPQGGVGPRRSFSSSKHLHRVGILQEDPLCRMCNEQDETAEHLLFDCPSIARERYAIFGSLDKGGEFPQENLIGCFRRFVELLKS
ncbi:hypothetical protein J6590_074037, partial [Homalodisca vitripennis]